MTKDNIVRMNNEVYILGRLATGRETYPNMVENQYAVSEMTGCEMGKEPNIVFFMESLSDEPNYSKNILNKGVFNEDVRDLYIGIDKQQFMTKAPLLGSSDIKKNMYKYLNTSQKEDLIYENLEGKLIIFKINLKKSNSGVAEYTKNLILEAILDVEDDGESYYKTIPEIQQSIEKFEDSIVRGNTIYLKGYTHDLTGLESIICDQYIYTFYMNDWEKVEGTIDGWRFIGKLDNIKKSELNIEKDEYDKLVIRRLDSVVFIEENYFYDNLLNDESAVGIDKKSKNEKYSFEEETDEQDGHNEERSEFGDKSDFENGSSEINFIKQLKNYTMTKNLCYDIKDIINLHVSIKTNPITIVAGMSGTGKTQISLSYADVLGLSEDKGTLLFLPITPSYTEPEDITGYLNTATGLFVPSETGLIDFLMHAQQYQNELHFVVFDEMNLSQVEHWFAPFISLLELDEKDRNLKLYSKNSVCHNKMQYNHTINIGDNIRFIGTVNLDETTKDFSDRLLDRANLVSLKKQSLKEFTTEKQSFDKKDIKHESYSFSDYKSWINKNGKIDALLDEEIDLLDKLHLLISSEDPQKGVSFRIAEKIDSYLQNLPIDDNGEYLLRRGVAFDLEIKQRVLTKIKGSERQFGKLIGKFDLEDKEIVNSKLYELFNSPEAKNISDFELTKSDIERKARELTVYGYTN